MAQCNFSIQFSATADEVAEKARRQITAAGGNFQGNASAGNFEVSTPLGAIRGNYVIQQAVIHVTITAKPFLVSCGLIEKQLQGYFAAIV
jgi:hypothetical protein